MGLYIELKKKRFFVCGDHVVTLIDVNESTCTIDVDGKEFLLSEGMSLALDNLEIIIKYQRYISVYNSARFDVSANKDDIKIDRDAVYLRKMVQAGQGVEAARIMEKANIRKSEVYNKLRGMR